MDKIKDLWRYCLLGWFAGRFPGLKALQNLVDSWKTRCSILPHFNGWVVFQFESSEEIDKVLAQGPYFVFGRTLLLRSIPENIYFRDEDYSVVPVWLQLQSLPLQCWNTRAISKIASKVCKPLCVDNFTIQRKRISYARVLVDIDTSETPKETIEVRLPCGTVYNQYIYYENLPKFCKHGYYFGHYVGNCKHLHKHMETEQTEDPAKKTNDDGKNDENHVSNPTDNNTNMATQNTDVLLLLNSENTTKENEGSNPTEDKNEKESTMPIAGE